MLKPRSRLPLCLHSSLVPRLCRPANRPHEMQRVSRAKPLRAWQRVVIKMMMWLETANKWITSNAMIRELKHRGPALMGYMENILMEEKQGNTIPATLPPSTTQAPGQTRRVVSTGYPMHYTQCPHELESARWLGNAHGKFLECIQCGMVKKAFKEDYVLPVTCEKVTVYGITHGLRDRPGGKVHPRLRDPEDFSSRSVVEAPINPSTSKKTPTKSKRFLEAKASDSSKRESSRDWEEVNLITDEEM